MIQHRGDTLVVTVFAEHFESLEVLMQGLGGPLMHHSEEMMSIDFATGST